MGRYILFQKAIRTREIPFTRFLRRGGRGAVEYCSCATSGLCRRWFVNPARAERLSGLSRRSNRSMHCDNDQCTVITHHRYTLTKARNPSILITSDVRFPYCSTFTSRYLSVYTLFIRLSVERWTRVKVSYF